MLAGFEVRWLKDVLAGSDFKRMLKDVLAGFK